MASNNYAHPEALVETDWLAQHLKDDGIRVIESNEDIRLYDTGHIPGAVHIDWRADLQDPLIRDYIFPEKFARLCSRYGITPDTTCIFYGDKANWWACHRKKYTSYQVLFRTGCKGAQIFPGKYNRELAGLADRRA